MKTPATITDQRDRFRRVYRLLPLTPIHRKQRVQLVSTFVEQKWWRESGNAVVQAWSGKVAQSPQDLINAHRTMREDMRKIGQMLEGVELRMAQIEAAGKSLCDPTDPSLTCLSAWHYL